MGWGRAQELVCGLPTRQDGGALSFRIGQQRCAGLLCHPSHLMHTRSVRCWCASATGTYLLLCWLRGCAVRLAAGVSCWGLACSSADRGACLMGSPADPIRQPTLPSLLQAEWQHLITARNCTAHTVPRYAARMSLLLINLGLSPCDKPFAWLGNHACILRLHAGMPGWTKPNAIACADFVSRAHLTPSSSCH